MALFDLFSKRQKALRGEVPEIFVYDNIPQTLRVQIVHIIRDAFDQIDDYIYEQLYKETGYVSIHNILCREYGRFTLIKDYGASAKEKLIEFMLGSKENDEVLDVIELSFKFIDKVVRDILHRYENVFQVKITADDAIAELNQRFKETGIGYQFEGGEIIRVDSTYIHSEITKPAINLLWNNKFAGANEEYLKAHEHYRHGDNKECLTDCLKAFESTMKIICKEKGWSYNPTDTAKKLIQICFDNNLIPSFTQNQFTSLQNLLVSGIPTIRNKVGAHGQGQIPQKVDDEMTRYGLNLTGTNIIFLVELSGVL